MVAKPAQKSVAIIVPPNAQSLDVSGPLDACLEANRHASGGPLYEVRLVATGARRTIKVGGMSLVADSSIFDDVRSIDTMLVAGTPDCAMPTAAEISTRRDAVLRTEIWLGMHGCILSVRRASSTE
jgi:transcriptional regulator GlxA family with amidase domain